MSDKPTSEELAELNGTPTAAELAELSGGTKPAASPAPTGPTLTEKWGKPPSAAESAVLGTMQGASYGLSDELAGVLGGAREGVDMVGRKLGLSEPLDPSEDVTDDRENNPVAGRSGPWQRILEAYRSERNAARTDDKAAQKANPSAYLAGNVAGAIAAPGPKIAPIKGAAVVPKIAKGAQTGAAYGAAYGLGGSEAEDVGGMALDTAKGAGLGLATGGVMSGLAAKAAPGLAKLADLRSFQSLKPRVSLGGMESKINALELKSPKGDPAGYQRQLGRLMLDEGITVPFGTAEGAADRSARSLEEAGAAKGATLGRIHDEATAAGLNPRVSLPGVATALENEGNSLRMEPGSEKLGGYLLNQSKNLRETATRRLAGGRDDYLSLLEAEAAKSRMQRSAKYSRRGSPAEEAAKAAASKMRQAVEDEAERVSGPEDLSQFIALKQRYGKLADIDAIADYGAKRAARSEGGGLAGEIANRLSLQGESSPKDSIAGWAKGQALDAWKNRRPATMAHIYDQLSKRSSQIADSAPRTLADYFAVMKKEDQ